MSASRISKVGLVKRGSDGTEATVFTDGDSRDGADRWAEVLALREPRVEVGVLLQLEDLHQVLLPFSELAWLLPDKTGVLAIFRSGSYTHPDGNDVFPAPNNAAIYNADGSLRCQVHFAGRPEWNSDYIIERPFTRSIAYKELPIGRPGEPIDPPIVQFGVLVGTKDRPPESFFVLNTETGELTDGHYTVPY